MGSTRELLVGSPLTMAPLLLRNFVSSVFVLFDDSLNCVSQNHKLIGLLRSVVASSFLLFLRLLSYSLGHPHDNKTTEDHDLAFPSPPPGGDAGGSGLARALSQLLSIANEVPVGSRKYDVVRSLAERLIDDNEREGSPALHEVNRAALSAALSRTLSLLEEAAAASVEGGADSARGGPRWCYKVARLAWSGRAAEGPPAGGLPAEKLAAELLWLAQKAVDCGFGEEAVRRWATAGGLARLALSAEPRLQCSLVKLSAFMLMQVGKEMGEAKEEDKEEKMRMLQWWLPVLCQASNGTEAPVLSSGERAEVERVLGETIEKLGDKERQEKVLCLWLHHYTRCSSSDWPDLHHSFARWCTHSRQLLLHNNNSIPRI